MQNNQRFAALIPHTLRSIPYILQTHVFKAYCALENLHAQKPHLPQSVWDYCVDLIENDEPKVSGIIAPQLLKLKEIVDPTSGRDFGPDWILGRGLMPLSYWAMRKKVEEIGVQGVFQIYLEKALDHPKFLGHEISVFAGNWQFYQDVIAQDPNPENHELFIQRFTEFAVTTFAHGNDTVFEHPQIQSTPSESEILLEALHNPAFFGHNILAVVWNRRLKSLMTPEQYEKSLYNLTVLNRWHQFGKPPAHLDALQEDWDEATFDAHLTEYFPNGPTNIHQITLAEALLWVWIHHPEYRRLVAANVVCFSESSGP